MRLILAGDVMLGRLVDRALQRRPPESVWGDTLPVMAMADCRICNLECALTARPGRPPQPKTFCFWSDAANVAVLRAARIDAVSVANNHVLDAGAHSLVEMLCLLDRAGIAHAGAGADAAAARRPAVLERAGTRLALLACTDNEPSWEAGHGRPGVVHTPDDPGDPRVGVLLGCVEEARAAADLVVVSLHWGPNWGREPTDAHRRLAHALLDAGASVVFGHSPHVVRGIELHRGGAVLYGAGDFVDDYAVDPVERNDESAIFVLETEGAEIRRIDVRPTLIVDLHAQLARGTAAERIAARMQRLCGRLGTEAAWNGETLQILPAASPAAASPGAAGR